MNNIVTKEWFEKNHVQKPPLGLIPKRFVQSQDVLSRFADVCGAINRYKEAKMEIPSEWLEEYFEIIGLGEIIIIVE